MLNILTIDIEDYFQVHAFSNVIKFEDWDIYECRIERNVDRLLTILSSVPSPHLLKPKHSRTATLSNSITHSLNNSFTKGVKGTFFVLGWLAERYPGLVKRIQKEGHEIACHGYAHQLIYTQSKEEFRQDIRKTKAILEDITGSEVIGYRAPSYSITNKSQWAFEVLVEEGFKYDSSIFPIRHDFYGMPNAPRFPFVVSLNGNSNVEFSMLDVELGIAAPHHRSTAALDNSLTYSLNNSVSEPQSSVLEASKQHQGSTAALNNSFAHSLIHSSSDISALQHRNTAEPLEGVTPSSELRTQHSLIEFPISTVKILGQNFPISGGGYFRLFPYPLIRKGLKSINQIENKPFIFYAHPWEIDPEQPRINGISFRSKFRHYVNLDGTEPKFKKLLEDFQFSTIRQFLI